MPQERPPFSRKSVSNAVWFTGSFPCGHCSILLSYCTNWFIFIAATRLQSKAASEPDQSLQGGSYRQPSVLLAQLSRHGKQNRLEARPSMQRCWSFLPNPLPSKPGYFSLYVAQIFLYSQSLGIPLGSGMGEGPLWVD